MYAVTPRCDIAHRLREQLGVNLGIERAIPGYGPFEGQPTFTAKGCGVGVAQGVCDAAGSCRQSRGGQAGVSGGRGRGESRITGLIHGTGTKH